MSTDIKDDTMIFVPDTDVYEEDNIITLVVDLPGVDENSVDVQLDKNQLQISAKAEKSQFKKDYKIQHTEYYTGDFKRTWAIKEALDPEKIDAQIKDGVLTLQLHKLKKDTAKKIEVRSA
ncbi:Hsp20/alpha crystallin family protein [Candidatus Uabimicrobium sp. HlEnr_7]|uniref:Hsp20/alpha crystallin family protein n=1 Tax=Candidatus Uabimicrobium helgolandensis TaxID=3095367 RepID=UPI0035560CA8